MVLYLHLLIKWENVYSVHFHHFHSLLLGAPSSLPEPPSCIFGSFLEPSSAQRPRQPRGSPNGSTRRCKSRRIVGDAKEICPNFSNLLETFLYTTHSMKTKKRLKRKKGLYLIGRHFLSHWTPFFYLRLGTTSLEKKLKFRLLYTI